MAAPITDPPKKAPWPWPDSLDAVIAAPQYHRLVLENERVRVLDTQIPSGDIVPVHTHTAGRPSITRSQRAISFAGTARARSSSIAARCLGC
jgi:hypothetical protein